MPWEKSFDEELAVEKAMHVFWQKGYESASIADLIAGTGVNRGSLYNAFGGKQALFVKALQKYDNDRQSMLARLEAMDDPRAAVAAFFDTLVANTANDAEHKGCFLFNTALDISVHPAEVQQIVTNGIRENEAFFRRSIEVGQARGDIRGDIDPASTARALVAMIVAIRVLGRGVYEESALRGIAEQAQQLLQ